MGPGELYGFMSRFPWLIWEFVKVHMAIFSENPDRFPKESVCLSLSYSLTWQDVIVVLTHCCAPGEKES